MVQYKIHSANSITLIICMKYRFIKIYISSNPLKYPIFRIIERS